MPDGVAAILDRSPVPVVTADEGINVTQDFQIAVADAGKLFGYAASNGLLSMTGSDDIRGMIQPLLRANGATQLSLQRVTDFWIAYTCLTHLVKPITASSLAASGKISLFGMKSRATTVVALVIVFRHHVATATKPSDFRWTQRRSLCVLVVEPIHMTQHFLLSRSLTPMSCSVIPACRRSSVMPSPSNKHASGG